MTTHILSMTYGPKIEAVFGGTNDQTIRLVRSDAPWNVGDKAILHTWAGRPYASPWGRRLDTSIKELEYFYLEKGIGWFNAREPLVREPIGPKLTEEHMDALAVRDGIVPGKASALINTLMALNGLTQEQLYCAMFRAIRWPLPGPMVKGC